MSTFMGLASVLILPTLAFLTPCSRSCGVSSHLVILITQMAIRLQWQWSYPLAGAFLGLTAKAALTC